MNARTWAGIAFLSALLAAPWTAAAATDVQWNFTALLDGKPIGTHRFSVRAQGPERLVQSAADFDVRILGLSAYRYRHRAAETWQGDCLAALEASTDDDGSRSDVKVQPSPGCVMSFAYWNPAIRGQARLLNAQTGQVDAVQVRRMDSGTIVVRGKPVSAVRWRISGPPQPVDVWYAADTDEWIGLDSTVAGNRQLSYRLR